LDPAIITAIIFGVLGTAVSLFALIYTQRQTSYMKRQTSSIVEQVDILKRDADKKVRFEKTSDAILQSIDFVKKQDAILQRVDPIDIIVTEIITYLHDSRTEELNLAVIPNQKLRHLIVEGDKRVVQYIYETDDLITSVKKKSANQIFTLDFVVNPDVIENKTLSFSEPFHIISQYYQALKIVEPYESIIRSFDDTVIDDIKDTLREILETVFRTVTSRRCFVFEATDSSGVISETFYDEFFNKKAVEELEAELRSHFYTRLLIVQKEVFQRA
jgi:hypothetical protein